MLDRRLGISDKHNSCETCGMRMQDCPGHFGYIRLELPVLLHCADPRVPGPPYCAYRRRLPASCVAYVPEAQGSWCATVRTPYTYQPRRAVRTAYRVVHHRRCAAPVV